MCEEGSKERHLTPLLFRFVSSSFSSFTLDKNSLRSSKPTKGKGKGICTQESVGGAPASFVVFFLSLFLFVFCSGLSFLSTLCLLTKIFPLFLCAFSASYTRWAAVALHRGPNRLTATPPPAAGGGRHKRGRLHDRYRLSSRTYTQTSTLSLLLSLFFFFFSLLCLDRCRQLDLQQTARVCFWFGGLILIHTYRARSLTLTHTLLRSFTPRSTLCFFLDFSWLSFFFGVHVWL